MFKMFQNSIWDRECLKVGIYHTKYENEDAFQHHALERPRHWLHKFAQNSSKGKNDFRYSINSNKKVLFLPLLIFKLHNTATKDTEKN